MNLPPPVSPKMTMPPRLRLAYPTRLLEGTLREKLRQAATLRVSGVQIDLRSELRPGELSDTGRRQFHQLLTEQNLQLAPAVFLLRRSLIDAHGLEERVHAISTAMRFAAELKITTLLIRPGGLPAEDSPEAVLLQEVVSDLARVGNHIGVTLALTNGREQPARVARLLQGVQTGPIGVNFDPAALVMSEQDPATALMLWHQWIKHVRVRDGLSESDGPGSEVAVGRGDVSWTDLFGGLAEVEFGGWLTPDRTSGESPRDDVAAAIRFVRNVLPFGSAM